MVWLDEAIIITLLERGLPSALFIKRSHLPTKFIFGYDGFNLFIGCLDSVVTNDKAYECRNTLNAVNFFIPIAGTTSGDLYCQALHGNIVTDFTSKVDKDLSRKQGIDGYTSWTFFFTYWLVFNVVESSWWSYGFLRCFNTLHAAEFGKHCSEVLYFSMWQSKAKQAVMAQAHWKRWSTNESEVSTGMGR